MLVNICQRFCTFYILITENNYFKSFRNKLITYLFLFLISDLEELYDSCSTYYGVKDTWFVFGEFDPLCETTLRDKKTKNAFMVCVKDIRVHDFRHSCASLFIDSGANITLVAKYLGHSKIDETLNTYSHMYQNRLDTIVNIIERQNDGYLEYKQQLPKQKNNH